MSVALSAAVTGRAAAILLMVDTCTITAPGAMTYDVDTDRDVPGVGAVRYAGPCRVKPRDNNDRVVNASEQTVTLWPYVVSVPVDAVDIELDDVVHITAAPGDPELVDLRLRVRDVPKGSLLTARRLGCEVQSS